MIVSTTKSKGVILYQGFDQHVAVEIFRGRVRVSYDIGNYPVSTLFSYEKINDGELHTLEMVMVKKNFSMKIDGGQRRTIINQGDREYMEQEEPMFVGGVSSDVKESAVKKWHIRNAESLKGRCLVPNMLPVYRCSCLQ